MNGVFEALHGDELQDSHAPSRRTFIKLAAGLGAGLVLGVRVGDPVLAQGFAPTPSLPASYVRIAPEGTVSIFVKNPEIGQGCRVPKLTSAPRLTWPVPCHN